MTKTFKLSENLRRNIARFFLPILTVLLIAMPSQSYAVIPLVIAGVAAADSAAAAAAVSASIASATAGAAAATTLGVVFIDAGMTAATGLISTVAAYFILTYPDGSEHRIPTTTDPSKQVPAPVAPPSAVLTSTPIAYNFNICTTANGSNCFSSAVSFDDALQKYCALYGVTATCISGVYPTFQGLSSTGFVVSKPTVSYGLVGNTQTIVDTVYALASASTYANSCPVGYSGIPCLIVDARAAAPDNKCDFGRSGGGFSMITDPDCAKNLNVKSNADGSLDFTGKDKYGRPVTVHFQPTPAGGTAVGITAQAADAAGNTVNTNLNLNVNPAGLIDGATQTQTTPSGAPATSPAVNPATGTTPTTNPASPTDYARQGEAAAATVPVTAELQKLNANFTTVPTTDPLVPLSTDVPTFGSTFNNLTRFKLPGHFSACPTPSFNLSNMGMGVYTLDSHCNLLNGNSAPIRNSMIIVFLLSALFIVLRA